MCDMICSHKMPTLFHESTSGMPCVFGAGVGSATRPCLSMLAAGCGTFGWCSSEKTGPKMAENHWSRKWRQMLGQDVEMVAVPFWNVGNFMLSTVVRRCLNYAVWSKLGYTYHIMSHVSLSQHMIWFCFKSGCWHSAVAMAQLQNCRKPARGFGATLRHHDRGHWMCLSPPWLVTDRITTSGQIWCCLWK